MSRFSVAVVVVFLAVATVFFVVLPQWRGIGSLRAEIGGLEALNDELAKIADQRDLLTKEYNAISDEDLAKLRSIAPANSDNSTVLVDFEALAQKNNLVLSQVDFNAGEKNQIAGAAARSRVFGAIPVTLALRGSYEGFRGFLQALERNLRVMDVSEINFSGGDGKSLSTSVRGRIYYRR